MNTETTRLTNDELLAKMRSDALMETTFGPLLGGGPMKNIMNALRPAMLAIVSMIEDETCCESHKLLVIIGTISNLIRSTDRSHILLTALTAAYSAESKLHTPDADFRADLDAMKLAEQQETKRHAH